MLYDILWYESKVSIDQYNLKECKTQLRYRTSEGKIVQLILKGSVK